MFTFLSLKKNTDSLLAGAAGFIIIILFTRHSSAGVNPDSITYITVAQHLLTNGQLVDFMQHNLVEFPAFYPVFLSAIMWVAGLQPLLFAPVLNALLFAVVIYLSGCIAGQSFKVSRWYKVAVLSCLVLSPALLEVYSMVWSETLFILLLLLFIIAVQFYLTVNSRRALIAAAIFAALAAVTRYAGVTIIITGAILVFANTTFPWRQRFREAVLFCLISSLPLAANLARNYWLSETATGNRETAVVSLAENLHAAGSTLYNWLPFLNGHSKGAAWLVVILIAFLAVIPARKIFKNGRLSSFEDIAAVFLLLYLVFIIVVASLSRFQTLDSRLLSPVFIPLLLVVSNAIFSALKTAGSKRKPLVIILAIIVFLCFQYGQLAVDSETWDGVKDAGIPGYTEDQWRYSETVLFIQKNLRLFQKGYTIYANANDAVYFFTGRVGKFLPHREYATEVQEFLQDRKCYVVWFDDGDNPDLVSKAYLTNVKKLRLLKQCVDGAVYVSK